MARIHGVLLLCTWLANDRPLSSSQAVWARHELMHCNMTVIIPLGEPAVLQGSFSFSFESKVSQLPLSLSLCCILSSVLLFRHLLLFSLLLLLPLRFSPFNSYRQTVHWGSLSPTALQCNICSLLLGLSLDGCLWIPFYRTGGDR